MALLRTNSVILHSESYDVVGGGRHTGIVAAGGDNRDVLAAVPGGECVLLGFFRRLVRSRVRKKSSERQGGVLTALPASRL